MDNIESYEGKYLFRISKPAYEAGIETNHRDEGLSKRTHPLLLVDYSIATREVSMTTLSFLKLDIL